MVPRAFATPLLSLGCLRWSHVWGVELPGRAGNIHFISDESVGICLDHWDVLCFGPWNNDFALGESGRLCQVPIQDGRVTSNPRCLTSREGQGPSSGKSPSSKLHHSPANISWHFSGISTHFTVWFPGQDGLKGILEVKLPEIWLCLPARSSAPAPLLPQVIWFPRKEYL